jgi:hypothetical protein
MKKILMIFVIFVIFVTTNTYSSTTYKSSHFIVQNSLENVINQIIDYENYCKNCKYKLNSVKEIKIIKDKESAKGSFYIWTNVESIMNSKYFSHVKVKKEKGSVFITQKQVDPKVAKILERKTGLKHDPLLEDISSTYELFKNKKKIHINYTIKVGYSGLILNLASNSIKIGIEDSIKEIKRNIASLKKSN